MMNHTIQVNRRKLKVLIPLSLIILLLIFLSVHNGAEKSIVNPEKDTSKIRKQVKVEYVNQKKAGINNNNNNNNPNAEVYHGKNSLDDLEKENERLMQLDANHIAKKKKIGLTSIDSNKYGIYSNLFTLLAKTKPRASPIVEYKHKNARIQTFAKLNLAYNKRFLSSLLRLSYSSKVDITNAYNQFITNKEKLNMKVFGNENNGKIQGRGVVIVGGGKYSWLALLNIHQLRKTGSILPVEVYIPSEKDYDETFCDSVLPALNARCILGYQELPLEDVKQYFKPQSYTFKILAILTSTFEDILLLDSDNVVLYNPDSLFDWNTYKNYQLVLWPDCWHRTTNPFIFDLFDIKIDYSSVDEKNGNYILHNLPGAVPNPSSESGMLLVNKKTHVDTLLLTLYMNVYGPDYYYPLITQGAAGEGDKDTYILAAYALKKYVYQVKQDLSFVGRFQNKKFISGALGQCDPTTQIESRIQRNSGIECEKYLFLHMSYPKYFPEEITQNFIDDKGNHSIEFETIKWDYDFELQMWEIMCQLLCKNYEKNSVDQYNDASSLLDVKFRQTGKQLKYISSLKIENICNKELLPHLEFLRAFFHSKQ